MSTRFGKVRLPFAEDCLLFMCSLVGVKGNPSLVELLCFQGLKQWREACLFLLFSGLDTLEKECMLVANKQFGYSSCQSTQNARLQVPLEAFREAK